MAVTIAPIAITVPSVVDTHNRIDRAGIRHLGQVNPFTTIQIRVGRRRSSPSGKPHGEITPAVIELPVSH